MAVACGVAAYSMMNMVMTSAPLAMVMCNHSITDATLGLQWHVLGMYAPSFIAGSLISRFGLERITGLGFALILVAAGIGIAGISLWHFWIGLALLGVGWNFAFIGATTMVTHCHRPNERNKVQAFNDFLVFGSMAISSFSSGQLLASFGWATVNEVVFPVVLAAVALLGVGWNFAFIGATTMVTHCHRPNERNKVQAFNDFLVFGSMAIGSFSSGQLLASFGWATVNEVVFPVVLAAIALLLWCALRGPAPRRT